jgi:hypothetical protein
MLVLLIEGLLLIFHDLLGIIIEVYFSGIVVKLAGLNSHLDDLRFAFEKNVSIWFKDESSQMCLWSVGWQVFGFHCA